MLHNQYLKQWSTIVSSHFRHLSLPEVTGLATWSFGMVITGSSSLTKVSEFIAKVNGEKSNTVRRRLKEWSLDRNGKKARCAAALASSEKPKLGNFGMLPISNYTGM